MTPASPKIKTAARVSPYRVAHGLRGGARGTDSTQAPVELLIRSFGGRFTQPEQPCIVIDRSGQIGFNAEVPTEGSVGDTGRRAASAGRRRCLDGRHEFGRSCRALTGLDLDHSALALAALLEMSLWAYANSERRPK
ncbi:MAG TPA: hypothetical protein VJW23_17400 [Propionibacteriaceae bacterium]|nr:hypothetical protein [Propionibacteriaceae bacterium]